MKPCSPECPMCCDFCVWYVYNGTTPDKFSIYTGDGFCMLNGEQHDPEELCENFVCFHLKNGEYWDEHIEKGRAGEWKPCLTF